MSWQSKDMVPVYVALVVMSGLYGIVDLLVSAGILK